MEMEAGGGVPVVFPMLSCLNRDDMLCHAMTVPIILPEGGGKFMIGGAGGAVDNDFTLNGVGMQVKCWHAFEAKAFGQAFAIPR
jgi:hypothetical protein